MGSGFQGRLNLPPVFYTGVQPYQMYAEVVAPQPSAVERPPIVFLHGGGHTGACYRATPDGRPGWADCAAARGFPAIVADWPGHGRSGRPPDFARMSGARVVDAARALLERVGPAVLITHSMSGAFGWQLGEQIGENVLAIVAVAPSPPGNIQPIWSWPAYPEEQPISFTPEEVRHFTASPHFPAEAFDVYYRSVVPESARIYNERLNARGLQLQVQQAELVGSRPILVVSADTDPNHANGVDARTAAFFGAEHLVLSQHGLDGHGHLMMIERGNVEIAKLILDWIDEHLPR